MNNHIHLLLKETKEKLSRIFKRIGVRYVYWYNQKYNRQGHLFQDRFKSEPVDDEQYLLMVLRYIHQNPLKAEIVKSIEEYKYSSYNDYININNKSITDTPLVMDLLKNNNFKEFHIRISEDNCLDIEQNKIKLTDTNAKLIISNLSKCENVEQFLNLSIEDKERYIKIFKEKGMSYRQISRLTGISFGLIKKI